jgi:chromosome segregation ATPase
MKRRIFAITALAATVLGSSPAIPQVERSGGEAQKFMQQYQQMAAEKTALQGQLEKAKKDLDAASSELAAVKKERDALKAHPPGASPAAVAQLTADKDAAERGLAESKQRMTELVSRFRETATNLRDAEAGRSKLQADLNARNAAYDQCAENNQQLYEINADILNRYDHVGLFTKVGASEPFTQVTRTRMDNLVVETQARAQELRVMKRPTP